MKKRLLSLTLIAALCLSLFPTGAAPALAAENVPGTLVVGNVTVNTSQDGYWTTDGTTGNLTESSADKSWNVHYDMSTNTLYLNAATITASNNNNNNPSKVGIYASASENQPVSLNIILQGENKVSGDIGIYVYSSSNGDASLSIEGGGSLKASGSVNPGIWVQSNSSKATLTIQNAEVEATVSTSGSSGVTVQADESSEASLSVDGGSLTASGRKGILFPVGTPQLTVNNSTIVRASNGIGAGINEDSVTPDGTGIVFDDDKGTVYGEVILQEDLTIGEDESLKLADNNASLSAGGHNVIVDGGTLDDSIKNSLGDSVKYPPTITTESLPNGRVGEPYSASLGADGTAPITWSVTNGSLPTGLSLNGNTISGTPTTAGTSTFTVTATNTVGSDNSVATDSKQFTLTIEAATDVSVESVSLNETSLTLTEGASETLTATVKPDNATDQKVTWSSSDETVAKVDANGLVTTIAPGEATITVTTEDGSKTATCTVIVHTATTITTQPQSVSVTEGQSATFSVTATGDNLRYQWQINSGNGWSAITDATDASYTIDRTTTAMSGNQYRCIVTGDGGETTSSAATLTVRPYDPPYTGKYSYEIVSDVGENGTIDVDRYATEGDQVTITVSPDEAYLLDALTVTSGGKNVALTDNGDGTYTFTMPSGDVEITATFAEDPNWEEPEDPATDVSEIFTDVPANHWAQAAIQYVYDNGLMTGVSDTAFAPEATTIRAMIVSMLARLENVTSAADAGFTDVAADDWYTTAVNWAAANGIVSGISDDTFAPNDPITREQLAAMLMNYAQWKGLDTTARADLSGYTDAPSTWASEAVQWAVAEGLLAGVTDDQLQPQAATTRAQTAAVFQRFLTAESLENK